MINNYFINPCMGYEYKTKKFLKSVFTLSGFRAKVGFNVRTIEP